jgi:hypothetical protein
MNFISVKCVANNSIIYNLIGTELGVELRDLHLQGRLQIILDPTLSLNFPYVRYLLLQIWSWLNTISIFEDCVRDACT